MTPKTYVNKQNLDAYRYTDLKDTLAVLDANGAAYDLTAQEAFMEVRAIPSSTAVLYTASSANGKISVDTANSLLVLLIPGADVAAWGFSQAQYDLFIFGATGVPFAVVRGILRVWPSISVLP